MPTLNIKDPEVHRMAHELARLRGTTATGAVRDALTHELAGINTDRDRAHVAERLEELARRGVGLPTQFESDRELYNDRGLPQ